MKPLYFLTALAFSTTTVTAQQVINVDKDNYNAGSLYVNMGGQPVVKAKFVRLVEGTPFYVDQWQKSMLITPQGKVMKDVQVKLDLMDGNVHYLDAKGVEFIATTQVSEIILNDSVNNKEFRFISSLSLPQLKAGWYVPLVQGTVSLYKIFDKTLLEDKPYGSASTEQRIITKEKYVMVYNNKVYYLKSDKELPEVLADKKAEVEAFMKAQNKKQPLQEKLAEVVKQYNTLVTKPS